jgi:hypothetical protein
MSLLAGIAGMGAVLLSACQPDKQSVAIQPVSSVATAGSLQPLLAPTGPGKLTVTVRESGGRVAWGVTPAAPNVLHIADATMYRPADPSVGTSILRGVLQRPLSAEQQVAVASRMQSLGLFATTPLDVGTPVVADGPTLTIDITDDRGTYRHSVYALGETTGLTPAQLTLRDGLRTWLGDPLGEGNIAATGSPSDLTVFTALRLEVQFVGLVEPEALQKDENLNVARLWPLTDRLPDGCLDLTGEDARIVLDSLVDITHETVWVNDGRWMRIALRGLLPGEPPCRA